MSFATIGLTPKSLITITLATTDDEMPIVKRKKVLTLGDLGFSQLAINAKDFEARLDEAVRSWAHGQVSWHIDYAGAYEQLSGDEEVVYDLYFGAEKVGGFVDVLNDCLRFRCGGHDKNSLSAEACNAVLREWTDNIIRDYYTCHYLFGDVLPSMRNIMAKDAHQSMQA